MGRNVEPCICGPWPNPLFQWWLIISFFERLEGKRKRNPSVLFFWSSWFFCPSEFSLFSSCLKASYAGYVLITMRHLIVNTITVAQCTFLWLFMEVELYFNKELWMSPVSCISIEWIWSSTIHYETVFLMFIGDQCISVLLSLKNST